MNCDLAEKTSQIANHKTQRLQLLKELARRARDVYTARNIALTIFDALDDAGGFTALWAVGAFGGVHDLFAISGLGNLCHAKLS